MKIIQNIFMFVVLSTQCMSIFASDNSEQEQKDVNDIKQDYSQMPGTYKIDNGAVAFKARAFYMYMKPDQEMSIPAVNTNPKTVNGLINVVVGADAAATIYFNSNFALEMGAGFAWIRSDKQIIENISENYNVSAKASTNSDMYMIPITATFQYHIAAFGGFCPYLGAGYHGNYFINTSENFRIDNNHGPVIQIGINFINKDDTIFNLDIKKYFVTNVVSYTPLIVGRNNNVTSKMKANPIVISLGIGFKI